MIAKERCQRMTRMIANVFCQRILRIYANIFFKLPKKHSRTFVKFVDNKIRDHPRHSLAQKKYFTRLTRRGKIWHVKR